MEGSSSDNSTEENPGEYFHGQWFGKVSFLFALFGIFTSTASLIFAQFWLKLNTYLKSVLKICGATLFASNIVILSGFLTIRNEGLTRIDSCAMIISGMVCENGVSANASMIISAIRLYMYIKSLETKVAKPWKIIAMILGGVLSNIIILTCGMIMVVTFKVSGALLNCANVDPEVEVPIIAILIPLMILAQIVAGLFFEYRLKTLMKKKKNDPGPSQNQLIPWISASESDEEDLKIPTRATRISFLGFMACATMTSMGNVAMIFEYRIPAWISGILLQAWANIHLPLILTFTVKHHKSIAEKQPPNTLQFHEDIPDDGEIDESGAEQCQNNEAIFTVNLNETNTALPSAIEDSSSEGERRIPNRPTEKMELSEFLRLSQINQKDRGIRAKY